MLVISSVVRSADVARSLKMRVKREGSHSVPRMSSLNDHAPAASESGSNHEDSSAGDASVAIVSVGSSQFSIMGID